MPMYFMFWWYSTIDFYLFILHFATLPNLFISSRIWFVYFQITCFCCCFVFFCCFIGLTRKTFNMRSAIEHPWFLPNREKVFSLSPLKVMLAVEFSKMPFSGWRSFLYNQCADNSYHNEALNFIKSLPVFIEISIQFSHVSINMVNYIDRFKNVKSCISGINST